MAQEKKETKVETKAEKKEVRKYEPKAGKIITGWIHKAEILYLEDIRKS